MLTVSKPVSRRSPHRIFSRSEDVEAVALYNRGWSISAIAGHLNRDPKTIRAYVKGDRVAGVRKPAGPDPLEPFAGYVKARFLDDPHVWATALFDELGYSCGPPGSRGSE